MAALMAGTKVEISIVSAAKNTIATITEGSHTTGILPLIPSAPTKMSASRILLPRNARVILVPM